MHPRSPNCKSCGVLLTPENRAGLAAYCRPCYKPIHLNMVNDWKKRNPERDRLNRANYKEKYREKNRLKKRAYNALERVEVLKHYSPNLICVRCGFSDLRALSLDHIKGGGNKERIRLRRRGVNFYRWLKQNGYPNIYQVLCMNCQFIKRHENGEERKPRVKSSETLS